MTAGLNSLAWLADENSEDRSGMSMKKVERGV